MEHGDLPALVCNAIASVQIFSHCLIISIPDADFFHTASP